MDYLLSTTQITIDALMLYLKKEESFGIRGLKTGSIKEKKAVQIWSQIGSNPNTGDFLNNEIFQQMLPSIRELEEYNFSSGRNTNQYIPLCAT